MKRHLNQSVSRDTFIINAIRRGKSLQNGVIWQKNFQIKPIFLNYLKEQKSKSDATPPFTNEKLIANPGSSLYSEKGIVAKPNIKDKPFGEKVKKSKEVDEIVDNDGNIGKGDTPGNPNAFYRSKKTSDQVAKSSYGANGFFRYSWWCNRS